MLSDERIRELALGSVTHPNAFVQTRLESVERAIRLAVAETAEACRAELAAANEANAKLRAEVERLREDAERYRWLRHRLMCADFSYGEFRDSVLVFEWPSDARIGNNLDAAIDAARKE